MNLIYIFDNIYFNNSNSFIFNTIKRWILYELINNISNIDNNDIKYNNIILIKTEPSIYSCKLPLQTNISFEQLLLLINNIVYKKYDEYPTINLKNIFDELEQYSNTNSKIIIFSSIHKPKLELNNKVYINKILKKFKNNIYFYNVSKYSYLEKHFNNIKELFINHKSILINEIINSEIFSINKIDFAVQVNIINETKNISILIDKIELILIDNKLSNTLIINYILLINKIELLLINNIINSELVNLINKYFLINIDNISINKTIINNLKNFKNIIKNLFDKLNNLSPIIVPISSLSEDTSNIKYIMQFYFDIYPKLIKFHLDSTKKFKVANITTKTITMENINKISKINPENIYDNSGKIFVSNTTMTNWIDEYNEFNPFGILIKYKISKHAYKGIIDEYSSTLNSYPNIIVSSISNNWISLYDYYQMIIADLNNSNEDEYEYNPTNKEELDLNLFNIIDNLNGDTNIMLPIFINKKHWELTKILWSYHMSFINSTFEYEYNKKMDNIYYFTLLKCFNSFTDNTKFNNNFIQLFICLLRTCIQITIDNKYMGSSINEVDKYFNLFSSISNVDNKYDYFKNTFNNYLIRLLQLIVSSNSDINKVSNELEFIRNIIISMFIDNCWKSISNLSDVDKENEINILKNNCFENNKYFFQLEIDLICLCEFINKIYKIKNFNQFIKNIDAYNSCIPIDNIDGTINCELIKNIYNNLDTNKILNIDDYKSKINIDDYLTNIIGNKKIYEENNK
jgi:hypothetical protein